MKWVLLIGVFAFVLLAAIIGSRFAKETKPTTKYLITKEDSTRSADIATRFFHEWYGDKYKISSYYITPASLKYFWRLEAIKAPIKCPGKEEIIERIRDRSSPTDSLILVMALDVKEYDSFSHHYEDDLSGLTDVFLDREFRMLLVDCDSGLIYRKF